MILGCEFKAKYGGVQFITVKVVLCPNCVCSSKKKKRERERRKKKWTHNCEKFMCKKKKEKKERWKEKIEGDKL